MRNVFVDHIIPVVDPETGFMSWDEYIQRMFSDSENFQVLCDDCHTAKTAAERAVSTERKKKDKNNDEL